MFLSLLQVKMTLWKLGHNLYPNVFLTIDKDSLYLRTTQETLINREAFFLFMKPNLWYKELLNNKKSMVIVNLI